MKRTIRRLALVLALVLALSAAAMAKELDYTATNAQKNVHAASLKGKDCELSFDGDKLNVTYTDSKLKAGDMVIVFLLETADKQAITDDTVKPSITPTPSNIKYIDQSTAAATATAGNGSVSFSVYPQNHTNAVVRIISANVNAYVAAVKLDYTPGDANRDGKVDLMDVSAVLMYVVYTEKEEYQNIDLLAANVNGDDKIDIMDVSAILMYAVKDVPFKQSN